MFKVVTIILIALVVFMDLAVPVVAQTRPPTGTAKVSKVVVDSPDVDTEGSGCRAGTVGVAFSKDNAFMTVLFSDFEAAVGPQAGKARKRAFCRVNVTMSSPGWAFDVNSVDFRGYVNIVKGVNASLVTRWKWVDSKGNDIEGKGNAHKILKGPFEDDFLLHKDGETSDGEKSVCQKASAKLQISLSATLTPTTSSQSGLIQGSSADAAFGELMNLSWRKC
ncbi:hypothetical protein BS50DRAFT_645663 [Corynespora cassiicola Philippines]|uniref:DUF4360 domain-containing protein n=1 Tax=Corynespora cassiicola Philippines TaxID=1448308 RepID=A0A2T2NJ40_CORCC|nr:hypothetical protein BS50DRAFT_645663 [Corynespora cassiicola Philippines]